MKIKRNINLVSVAIYLLLFVIVAYLILFTLYDKFGLLGGNASKISEYTIGFVVDNNSNIKFEEGKKLYLYNTREYFGEIINVTYKDEKIIVKVTAEGTFENGAFLLNGKHYLATNSVAYMMNNKTEIQILSIY